MHGAYEINDARYVAYSTSTFIPSSNTINGHESLYTGLPLGGQSTLSSESYARDYSAISFPRTLECFEAAAVTENTSTCSYVKSAVNDNKSSGEGPSQRSRGQDKDKSEIKKRWHNIYKRGQSILTRQTTHKITSSRNDPRPSMSEAQDLLDEASQLTPYINSPGEDFAETVRALLGDLMTSLIANRHWVAEIHDCLASCPNKAPPSMAELKALLHKSETLLLSCPEERRLRDVINSAEKLGKEARKILNFGSTSTSLSNRSKSKKQSEQESTKKEESVVDVLMNSDVSGTSAMDIDDGDKEKDKDKKDKEVPVKQPIEAVSNLLKNARKLPFVLKEVDGLTTLYNKANKLALDIQTVIEKWEICKVRRPKLTGDPIRMSIEDAKKLCEEAKSFSLIIPLIPALSGLIEAGELWRQEVRAVGGNNSALASINTSSRSTRGANPAPAAGKKTEPAKAASLKRVEALLVEGEKMPFEFSAELDILREKKLQAKQWLERLKTKLPSKVGHSKALRGEGGGGSSGSDRMNLSDMKLIVQEGEELFEDGSSRSSQAKELSKAQTVVDVAEEWLARMKDILVEANNGSESSLEAIDTLNELLSEADDMPVFMEEAQVLRCHLQALEWAEKAKPILQIPGMSPPPPQPTPSIVESVKECEDVDDDTAGASGNKQSKTTPRIRGKPKLSEVQRLFREITRIRGNVPDEVWDDFPVKHLREETYCMEIVSKTEDWLARVKKIVSGPNTVKNGVELTTLRNLLEEGLSTNINLDNELRPLHTAIVAAENWIEKYAAPLNRLGIVCDTNRSVDHDKYANDKLEDKKEGSGGGGGKRVSKRNKSKNRNSDTVAGSDVVVAMDVDLDDDKDEKGDLGDAKLEDNEMISEENAGDPIDDSGPLTCARLRRIVLAANSLAADFHELRQARERLEAAERWLDQMHDIIPIRSTKRAISKPRNAEEYEALLLQVNELGLDMETEASQIRQALSHSSAWNLSTEARLNQIISESLTKIMGDYRELVTSKTKLLPYSCMYGLDNTGECDVDAKLDNEDAVMETVPSGETSVNDRLNGASSSSSSGTINHVQDSQDREIVAAAEKVCWDNFSAIKAEIEKLERESDEMGVIVPSSIRIKVLMAAFKWISDARRILMLSSKFEERSDISTPSHTAQGDSAVLQSNKKNKKRISNDFTFLDFSSVRDWGDVSREVILAMINDATFFSGGIDVAKANWIDLFAPFYRDSILEDLNIGSFSSNGSIPYEAISGKKIAALLSLPEPLTQKTTSASGKKGGGKEKEKDKEREKDDEKTSLPSSSQASTLTSPNASSSGTKTKTKKAKTEGPGASGAEEMNNGAVENSSGAEQKVDPEADGSGRSKRKREIINWSERVNVPIISKKTVSKVVEPEDENKEQIQNKPTKAKKSSTSSISATVSVSGTSNGNTAKGKGAKSAAEKRQSIDNGNGNREGDDLEGEVQDGTDDEDEKQIAGYLEPFAKSVGESANFPPVIEAFIELWTRLLAFHAARLPEIEYWSSKARRLISKSEVAAPGTVAKRIGDKVTRYLEWASRRGLCMQQRRILENLVKQWEDWVEQAKGISARNTKYLLNIELMRDFIKTGEKLLIDCPELHDMREELRRAKAWYTKLRNSGVDKGTASSAEMQELIAEGEKLCVDVSADVDQIQQTTKVYCFCRQAFHGNMVGCDLCDEWYHLPCVGLTKAQADRFDKYVCLRCTLYTSFSQGAVTAAQTINAWMNPDEITRARELRKLKYTKKIAKEEKDFNRLKTAVDEMTRIEEQNKLLADMEGRPDMGNIAPGANGMLTGTVAEKLNSSHLNNLKAELEESRARLAKSKADQREVVAQIDAEAAKRDAIVAWMIEMQKIMWPSNDAELEIGKPLAPDHKRAHQITLEDCLCRPGTLSIYSLLADGMCAMADKAISMGIDKMEDVVIVLDCFRWLSWCSVCSNILRTPPTTMMMRRLLNATKPLRVFDDKILRFLSGVLTRAASWKIKARKMARANPNRRIESVKLSALVLEASTIPMTSRVKDIYRAAFESATAFAAAAGTPAYIPPIDDGNDEESASAFAKKQNKIAIALSRGFPNNLSLSADCPYSSDEDEIKNNRASKASKAISLVLFQSDSSAEDESDRNPNPNVISTVPYMKMASNFMATVAAMQWPVQLSFNPAPFVPSSTSRANTIPSTSSSSVPSESYDSAMNTKRKIDEVTADDDRINKEQRVENH